MASGRTLLEVDEKKPPGFFPKLYESVIYSMGKEKLDCMEGLTNDTDSLIRQEIHSYNLLCKCTYILYIVGSRTSSTTLRKVFR